MTTATILGWPDIRQRLINARRWLGSLNHNIDTGNDDQELIGFMAQQAVENALKGWISAIDCDYTNIHRIDLLADIVPDNTAAGSSPARDELDALVEFITLPPEQLAQRAAQRAARLADRIRSSLPLRRRGARAGRRWLPGVARAYHLRGDGFRGGDIPYNRDRAGGFGERELKSGSVLVKACVGILLLAVALTVAGCATGEEAGTQVEATVALELTRLAPTTALESTTMPRISAASQPTAEYLVNKLRSKLVKIVTPFGSGSGFVYDSNGLVVTSSSTVECCRDVTAARKHVKFSGTVLGRDTEADIAVVQLYPGSFAPVRTASSSTVAKGDDVLALAFPTDGYDVVITSGIITARREINGYEYLQTDMVLNPGSGGGPLLNRDGDVVGIITFGVSEAEGVGLALSVDELEGRLAELASFLPESTDIFQQVSAGGQRACGVKIDGSVVCWGSDVYSEAGPLDKKFQQVSARGFHTYGVQTNGSAVRWGVPPIPVASVLGTPPKEEFQQVSTASYHTCGLKTDDSVVCWGSDEHGKSTPPNGKFQQVSAGEIHTCGLKTDSTIACWGSDKYGQTTPPDEKFQQVSAGGIHTCGVKTDGRVVCWGSNTDYSGGLTGQATPPGGEFLQVSAGFLHTCGVKTDGRVVCWGSNTDHLGGLTGQATPPDGEFLQVSAGYLHTCGVKTNGRVVCWGDNSAGQATPP